MLSTPPRAPRLGPQEMEVGMGIHNEPGVRKAPLGTCTEVVSTCVDTIMSTPINECKFVEGTSVALMVNGLGGSPLLELGVAAHVAVEHVTRYVLCAAM